MNSVSPLRSLPSSLSLLGDHAWVAEGGGVGVGGWGEGWALASSRTGWS